MCQHIELFLNMRALVVLFKSLIVIGIISSFVAFYALQWDKYFDENTREEGGFCAEKRNILFLKTHKTASTTLLMMFQRYAQKHRLIMGKKVERNEMKKFHRCSIYPLKPGFEYNIFAHHTIFNYEEMKDLMPNDTVFLTILRDPVAQFESQYGYFSMENVYGMNITAFADLNTSLPEWSRVKNQRRKGRNGLNPNAYDLGFDPELFEDEDAILEKVRELDKQFDLVMITELFYESMILMKDQLCWKELSDVTSAKSFVRKPEMKVSLSSERQENLRRMNRADQMIYDHFYKKFLRQIDAFGKEKMAEEVEKLRDLTEEIDTVCVEYKNVGLRDNSTGNLQTKFKAGAEKHEVCRAIMRHQNSAGWKKFNKEVTAKKINCKN